MPIAYVIRANYSFSITNKMSEVVEKKKEIKLNKN